MKNISIYMAICAMALSACSKDESALQTNEEAYRLEAEICSPDKSRVIINDKNTQGKSPLHWSETDAFLAFKSAAEISNNATFYATYATKNGMIIYSPTVDFYAKTHVDESNIVYGLFPYNKVDVAATSPELKVAVNPEIDIKDSHNAIMLGKKESGSMKFYQTMGLLEMNFTSLEGIDGLQIKANRPIATKEKGFNATLAIPGNTRDAKVTLATDDSKTIILNKGYGSFSKIYCPLPVANDYTEITISYVFKVGFNKVISDTPYVTIKAKNGTFAVDKNIYSVDCTSSNTTYVGASLPKWNDEDLVSGK